MRDQLVIQVMRWQVNKQIMGMLGNCVNLPRSVIEWDKEALNGFTSTLPSLNSHQLEIKRLFLS
jgi:hypothetical protein